MLRKKTDQLSFLHVYHHSTMFAFWWVGAKFVPGGTALSAAMVNCFVHVLMYTYYAIAALQLRPLLGWKRQLTLLQLVQFSVGVLLGIRAIVTNCQFTRWMQYFFVCYAFSFILLFGQFYRRTYGRSSSISSTACTAISSHSKTKVDPPGGEIERTYNKHTDHKKKKIVKKKSKMIRIDSKKRTKTKSSPQSS